MSSAQPAIRTFQPSEPSIARATDLGGVDVLKQGNLYLITDPFGDIHPDSRGLGLYAGETRILSCSVLRIDGVPADACCGATRARASGARSS